MRKLLLSVALFAACAATPALAQPDQGGSTTVPANFSLDPGRGDFSSKSSLDAIDRTVSRKAACEPSWTPLRRARMGCPLLTPAQQRAAADQAQSASKSAPKPQN